MQSPSADARRTLPCDSRPTRGGFSATFQRQCTPQARLRPGGEPMKAIVYHGKADFRYEQTQDPRIESDTDAIVRISKTAICGSDLHLWHGGLPDGIRSAAGFAVGHEFMGVVEEVGRGVHGLEKGEPRLTSCTLRSRRLPTVRPRP